MFQKRNVETTPERSKLMSRVRQSGTNVELAVREIVGRLGYDFKTNVSSLPGSPDLADPEHKWAVFVNGCFWHAHEGCERWTIPKRNRAFWMRKFLANRDRDKRKVAELEEDGYSVLVIWQCELDDETSLEIKISDFLKA